MRKATRRRFVRLTRAWLLAALRDRSFILWTLVAPAIGLALLGLALRSPGLGTYKVGVAVDESTPAGRELLDALQAVERFTVSTASEEEELAKLRDGERHAVVTLEPQGDAGSADGPTIVLIRYDPTRPTAQQLVVPTIQGLALGVERSLSGRAEVLRVRTESVLSKQLTVMELLVPAALTFGLVASGLNAAVPLVQLRVTKVFRRFAVTPLSRTLMLLTLGTARLALIMAQFLMLLGIGVLIGVRVSEGVFGWIQVVGLMVLGGATFIFFGIGASGVARTEESVSSVLSVAAVAVTFLSGAIIPVERLPALLQPISRLMPPSFLADGFRQLMVGGTPLNPLWLDFLAMVAWLGLSIGVATRFFRWE